jgi:ribonuclease P protein component
MLPKSKRLTVRDIESLSSGKSVFGTLISMRFLPSQETKLSVAASKKVAPRAVDRNKIRRRTYAALAGVRLKSPVFALLMPKREFLALPLPALRDEILALFRKAGLI